MRQALVAAVAVTGCGLGAYASAEVRTAGPVPPAVVLGENATVAPASSAEAAIRLVSNPPLLEPAEPIPSLPELTAPDRPTLDRGGPVIPPPPPQATAGQGVLRSPLDVSREPRLRFPESTSAAPDNIRIHSDRDRITITALNASLEAVLAMI